MTQTADVDPVELPGFVNVQGMALDELSLKQLIERCIVGRTWYCLRWPHDITFVAGLPDDFSCTEGQVFNSDRELRWKRQNGEYVVLLLSKTEVDDQALQPLDEKQTWLIRDLNAHFYSSTETRFPQGVSYPDELDMGQRYFIDRETGIVQFVALRGKKRGK
jgi:hypothetical protein